ncbi:MAG: 50S ribosomal protein L24 [Gammaproteobacteria bacterium]|nr:50S ribosomal protein L24 [Gammaproteobacteria bacterium]MCP5423794.1 50S ribosomal protein L24 [Gammaproteobacteria bacterium]
MRKIRSGDDVIVIAGKDKGRRGQVLRIVDHERVLVEGVNLVKRHTRANPAAGAPGGIIEREAPIHISNVMLYNPRTERGGRIGFRTLEDGRKVRYFKADNEVVDV